MGENSSELNLKSLLFVQAVHEACGAGVDIGNFSHNMTWESLNMSGPKPSKEKVEMLYERKLASIPMMKLREERNRLLAESDKYATFDFPHATEEQAEEWKVYRQLLRDMPASVGNAEKPIWPPVPEKKTGQMISVTDKLMQKVSELEARLANVEG